MADANDELTELDAWIRHVTTALGLPGSLGAHRQLLLDVARDAAHGVMRPAAPLTTFLVGFAAGLAAEGESCDVALLDAAATAMALANEWHNE